MDVCEWFPISRMFNNSVTEVKQLILLRPEVSFEIEKAGVIMRVENLECFWLNSAV